MQKYFKVSITEQARKDLESMKDEANEGFTKGHFTLQSMASAVIGEFRQKHFKKSLEALREANRDPALILKLALDSVEEARRQGLPDPSLSELAAKIR